MVMLTIGCRHSNIVVSARSVHRVVNGNTSASNTVTGDPRQQVGTGCQAVSHDVLWRRIDLARLGSAKQPAFDGPAVKDDKLDEETGSLVARRTCTSLQHDHHHRRHHHHHRQLRGSTHLCQVEKCRLRMRDDVFPPFVESGRCVGARTCLFGLYECVPRRHTVRLLRQLPPNEALSCLPVPDVPSDAVYKDVWVPFDFQVTVACECSRRRDSGVYSD